MVLSDTGLYRVVATNSQSSATSNTASLTVQKGVTINTQPVGTTLSQGGSYTLSVVVNGDATPAPTYQWYKNATAISGATASSLALSNVTGANAGNYYVVATNAVNSATSNTVYVGVISATMMAAASAPYGPVNNATAINPDALLTITLNQAVSVGVSGKIRVYDSTNSTTPVDTIDMSTAHVINTKNQSLTTVLASGSYMVKTIGGLTFNYMPVIVNGNTATIALHSSTALTYGKTYYVNIDPGVLLDSTGATYAGISDNTTWRFSTKASGPSAGATSLAVAADGSEIGRAHV